jgi:uncharacterized protein involved in exopolysaccharide biosynthesis
VKDDLMETSGAGARIDVEGTVSLRDVLLPVAARWRVLLGGAVAVGALAVGAMLLRGTRYEARIIVATVSSQQGFNLGGAAALLASAGGSAPAQSGLQVSPLLIADLMQSRRVLRAVGQSTMTGQVGTRIVDQVDERAVRDDKILEVMDDVVSARVSKETGLVSLSVTLKDSALAREVAKRIVTEVTRSYVETARAQATQLRHAQDVRVDSARRMLARLERDQQQFQQANRTIPSFSELSTQQQALQREVGVAEQVYSKAVSDREAAVAKELEETPVVVTIDPLPSSLPPTPRRLALFFGLATIASLLAGILWIFVSQALRDGTQPPPRSVTVTDLAVLRARGRADA